MRNAHQSRLFRRKIVGLLLIMATMLASVQPTLADGFGPTPGFKWHEYLCIGDEVCSVGDFNGDGKDDIIAFARSTQGGASEGDVRVALSDGTHFGSNDQWHDFFCIGNEVCTAGDVNGDGKADIIAFVRDTQGGIYRGDVWVALSTGSSFGQASIWHDFFCIGSEVCTVGDVNGDGKDDIIAFVRSTQGGASQGDVYVALTDLPSVPEPDEKAEEFGFGRMRINDVAASGVRPLLVMLIEFTGSQPLPHSPAFYENLIFGPTQPNVVDYYKEVSSNVFTWRKAGVLGPLSLQSSPENWANVKKLAVEAGFDFASYDNNHDGKISGDELAILVIDTGSDAWGVSDAHPGCVRPMGSLVDICAGVAFIGQRTSLTLAAHELSHLLGTEDIYGDECLNSRVSLMSCSEGADDLSTYHLDPWHKIQLGWIRPRIYRLTDSGTCTVLEAVQYGRISTNPGHQPIILYDPRRGTNEYLLIEFRTPIAPIGGGYDADVADQGIAIWYIQTNADKSLKTIPGFRQGENKADFLIAPRGLPGENPRGGNRLWKEANGTFSLQLQLDHWLDYIDRGLLLHVGLMTPTPAIVEIEWSYYGGPLRSYITGVNNSSVSAGTSIVLKGSYGVQQGDRKVSLKAVSRDYELAVERWTCSEVVVRVPREIPTGEYHLLIYDNASRTTASNWIPFVVTGSNEQSSSKVYLPLIQR